ncbi:MAG: glycosyltransferase [Gammaproteobacteria bacterium]|nr:glycosyltransferase [Gammaproteobacteria bacterium]
MDISIILPAKNEAAALIDLLPKLREEFPDNEIIVVDDGSTDNTAELCGKNKVTHLLQPYSIGNGAAIKAGARKAQGQTLVFMDADGQHKPSDISMLLDKIKEGYDLVVGARSGASQASLGRLCANSFYNWFASLMVGHKIPDLTSGFRAVNAKKFRQFLYLLPNGFSYPTTSTMAFFRSGYSVAYLPIEAEKRIGNSHIRILKDGARFLLILFKIGTLYSPLKIFLPLSACSFFTGMFYYLYTFITAGRFTNMSALLFTTSITIFLMGLVSEQITNLIYHRNNEN